MGTLPLASLISVTSNANRCNRAKAFPGAHLPWGLRRTGAESAPAWPRGWVHVGFVLGFWSGQKVGLEPVRWGLYLCGAVSPPPRLPSLGVPGGPRLLRVGKRTACLGAVCNTKTLLEFEWEPVGCGLMGGLVCRKAVNQPCACGWRTRRMLLDPSDGPVSRSLSGQVALRERGGPGLWSL